MDIARSGFLQTFLGAAATAATPATAEPRRPTTDQLDRAAAMRVLKLD